jgi:CTP-dependent riboflavin kinase
LGKGFIATLNKSDPIIKMLGTSPYPGTLFAQLEKPINFKGTIYINSNGILTRILVGFINENKVIVKWTVSYPRNLQIISHINLRSHLKLTDGNNIYVIFNRSDITRNTLLIYWYDFKRLMVPIKFITFLRRN